MTEDESADEMASAQDIPPDIRLKREQIALLNRAEKAMARLRQSFADWLVVGHAFRELQEEAELRSNSSKASGRHYTIWFEALLKQFLETRPHLARVRPNMRSRAIWMAKNEDEVTQWRDTLEDWQRDEWNSPSTIKRHFEASQEGVPLPEEDDDNLTAAERIARQFGDDTTFSEPDSETATGRARRTRHQPRQDSVRELRATITAQAAEIAQLYDEIGRLRARIAELEAALRQAGVAVEQEAAPEEAEDDEPAAEPAPRPPVTPPWCKPGKLAVRAALLLQAIEAAGSNGLHKWHDISPLELSDAASNRGIDAKVHLTHTSREAVEIDNRVYLRRFAPGAAPATPPVEEAPEPEPDSVPPILARLRAAGARGMTTFELMQMGFDALTLTAALAPLTAAGNVIMRDGRYFAAAEPR